MKALVAMGLFISVLSPVQASQNLLLSLESGKIFTVEQVEKDRKNMIPIMREKMCFYGDYTDAFWYLKGWADRQFSDIDVLPEPPERQIELVSYYKKCIQVDENAQVEPGESLPCLEYSERIQNGNRFIQSCF